ncbi:hypothetical protein QBC45DRAFT_323854 [Copromyces sp. CBS 386.78]|nr:hypothetical protein QBC45DRAFT_323854 [Copromyces sp. CBS 386.78]
MDPVSIARLILTCCEVGERVVKICKTLVDVDSQVQERSLTIQSYWHTSRLQLDFLKRIESVLDEDLCRLIDGLLLQLSQKLSVADTALDKFTRRNAPERSGLWGFGSKAKKASWVWKKDALDQIISDLDTWHRRFDPLWFMVTKTTSPLVDTALAGAQSAHGDRSNARGAVSVAKNPLTVAAGMRRVLYPSANLLKPKFLAEVQMEVSKISLSEATKGFMESERRWYIIDTVQVGPFARARDVLKDVSMLAVKLAQADPLAFGLLNCKGVIPVQSQPIESPASSLSSSSSRSRHDYSSFQLVFRLPDNMSALQSLRQLLLASDELVSLSRKMRIARELAKAVHYVHTFAFVHKNVRPESILCYEDGRASRSHAFLVGFDAFRAADGGTVMTGDMSWERNVYRHPFRQGFDPAERYRMQHDIYSLGVCLLEIGLWESFVEYSEEDEEFGRPRAQFGEPYYRFKNWLAEKGQATMKEARPANTFQALAFSLKQYLVEQARTRLAPRMGDKYAHIVLSCLTCLDDEKEDFDRREIEDVDDDTVAIHFAEKILNDLDQISMI